MKGKFEILPNRPGTLRLSLSSALDARLGGRERNDDSPHHIIELQVVFRAGDVAVVACDTGLCDSPIRIDGLENTLALLRNDAGIGPFGLLCHPL